MAPTQQDTLRLFTALCLVRQTWAGLLLGGLGLDDAGRALALASLAAGAASIFLEDAPERIRAAQREGCCTCTVTSLDEALRVVKNEVRQRRAVAVALRGEPAVWLREMVERGVQPQAFASSRALLEEESSATDVLRARGMETFRGLGLSHGHSDGIGLEDVLVQATRDAWRLEEQKAASLSERRTHDAELLQALLARDVMGLIAARWLHAAPALFPRALERAYWQRFRSE